VLKRSIDISDPFEPSFEEKIFRHGKRICFAFAGIALTLSALDLMNVRVVENAAEYLHNNPVRLSDLTQRVRLNLGNMAFASTEPYATAAIPSADIGVSIQSVKFAKPKVSPIIELAAARHQDAVELAMTAPAVVPHLQNAVVRATPEPLVANAPIQLASLGPVIGPPDIPSIVLPATLSVLPPPAPGVPPPSPAQRLKLEGKDRAKAEKCLATAIYFEARSEPYKGQVAVAQVIINRVFSPFYPDTVCDVVYQNAHRHLSCQFTFACDGKSKAIHERGAWARSSRIAKQVLDGQIYEPAVGTSTHYHAIYVSPSWRHEMRKNVRYGIHNFYRPYAWGSGADEPVWSRAALVQNKKK
jgi:hypothetical protein